MWDAVFSFNSAVVFGFCTRSGLPVPQSGMLHVMLWPAGVAPTILSSISVFISLVIFLCLNYGISTLVGMNIDYP